MTPQTDTAPLAQLTHAHLTVAQIEELLASSAVAPFNQVVPSISAMEEDAVILAQPESQYLPSSYPSTLAAAEAHLLLCPTCAAELANFRDSLSLFRQASSNHASRELNNLPPLSLPNRSLLFPALQPAHWVAVAATLLVALLPLQTFRQRPTQPAATTLDSAQSPSELQSDVALLDDVDREVSASVPTSMQALADPSGDSASASIQNPDQDPSQTSAQNPTQNLDQNPAQTPAQRKD